MPKLITAVSGTISELFAKAKNGQSINIGRYDASEVQIYDDDIFFVNDDDEFYRINDDGGLHKYGKHSCQLWFPKGKTIILTERRNKYAVLGVTKSKCTLKKEYRNELELSLHGSICIHKGAFYSMNAEIGKRKWIGRYAYIQSFPVPQGYVIETHTGNLSLVTESGRKTLGKHFNDGIDACKKGIIFSRNGSLFGLGFDGKQYSLGNHCYDNFYATTRGPVLVYNNKFTLVALKW